MVTLAPSVARLGTAATSKLSRQKTPPLPVETRCRPGVFVDEYSTGNVEACILDNPIFDRGDAQRERLVLSVQLVRPGDRDCTRAARPMHAASLAFEPGGESASPRIMRGV
jgi:hypothetical protein